MLVKNPETLAIIQCRMGSSRLPGKALLPIIEGKGALELMLERVQYAKSLHQVVVATTDKKEDDPVVKLCDRLGVRTFRGSESDVLDRYYKCAKVFGAQKTIVRLTADCPLIDPELVDQFVDYYHHHSYDYVADRPHHTYPDGIDVEVFSLKSLEQSWAEGKTVAEREHVTYFIYTHPEKFKIGTINAYEDLSHHRWTLDEPADLEFIKQVYSRLYQSGSIFLMKDILQLLKSNPELMKINYGIKRNEGLRKSLAMG